VSARFRSFRIQIISVVDGIQLEVADVDDKQMLIATDLDFPIAPRTHLQEAYGISDKFSDADIARIGDELSARLRARRAERSK
jgi:hypothetical protein